MSVPIVAPEAIRPAWLTVAPRGSGAISRAPVVAVGRHLTHALDLDADEFLA